MFSAAMSHMENATPQVVIYLLKQKGKNEGKNPYCHR